MIDFINAVETQFNDGSLSLKIQDESVRLISPRILNFSDEIAIDFLAHDGEEDFQGARVAHSRFLVLTCDEAMKLAERLMVCATRHA